MINFIFSFKLMMILPSGSDLKVMMLDLLQKVSMGKNLRYRLNESRLKFFSSASEYSLANVSNSFE